MQTVQDLETAFVRCLLRRAKAHLREIELSNRVAAKLLGRSFEHLSRVLNGHRQSTRLIREVLSLQPQR